MRMILLARMRMKLSMAQEVMPVLGRILAQQAALLLHWR